jgi:hypothetical protein
MTYNSVVISSGHGLHVRGASGIIDEVDEARRLTEAVAAALRFRGVAVETFHDNASTDQSSNLECIVDFHNSYQPHDLDISIHFNAFEPTPAPRGVEVLFVTQDMLAGEMSYAISHAGCLLDRGPKYRSDLYFLNNTDMPALLLEVCFVDSQSDCADYKENYDAIVDAIATVIGGDSSFIDRPPPTDIAITVGKVSYFGGPEDTGVSSSEGLAFIYEVDDAPHLFLPYQPEGTTGLARRLNPFVHYFAMRFDYSVHPKETLLSKIAMIRNVKTGMSLKAIPADWGPHESTDRVADLSPSLMDDLGLVTDDEVEVIFPYEAA